VVPGIEAPMIEPIGQLRSLRFRALLVREVCRRWAGGPDHALLIESALAAWRLSRVISGWLMGHPNRQYHPAPPAWTAIRSIGAGLAVRALHWSTGSRMRWLAQQLHILARDCADIRAVTSSVAINEMLGRQQPALSILQRSACPRLPQPTPGRTVSPATQVSYDAETWPFLTI